MNDDEGHSQPVLMSAASDAPHPYNTSGASPSLTYSQHESGARVNGYSQGEPFEMEHHPHEDDEEAGHGYVDQASQEHPEGSEAGEVDKRSIFVGNVDYGATPPELQEHFKNCGAINRITIMVDRYSGHPKGYAYIEFQDESAIPNAVLLNESVFRDRALKVIPKRKNVPGLNRGRGGFRGRAPFLGQPLRPVGMRGRGRGFRGGASFPGYFPRYRGRGQRGTSPY